MKKEKERGEKPNYRKYKGRILIKRRHKDLIAKDS